MGQDDQLQVAYLLALLILPVTYLVGRFTKGVGKPRRFSAQYGDKTYEGEYWAEHGIVYVRCAAGQRGRLMGTEHAGRVAEDLLIDIYRDRGLLDA